MNGVKKRVSGSPYNNPPLETTQLSPDKSESSTVSAVEQEGFWTHSMISATSCCKEKRILETCVGFCVIEVEKGQITVNSSCTESISIISKCIGYEVNKVIKLYNVAGK